MSGRTDKQEDQIFFFKTNRTYFREKKTKNRTIKKNAQTHTRTNTDNFRERVSDDDPCLRVKRVKYTIRSRRRRPEKTSVRAHATCVVLTIKRRAAGIPYGPSSSGTDYARRRRLWVRLFPVFATTSPTAYSLRPRATPPTTTT